MNKNILILSVLLALSSTSFANAGDQPTAEPPQPSAAAKAATAVVQKEKEAKDSTDKKETVNAVKVDGRDIVKDSDGKLAAYCETGMDCRKQVLATKEITDLAAISEELKKLAEESKKSEEKKKEETDKKVVVEDKFDRKEFAKELLADLQDSILDECDIETKSSRMRDLDDDIDTERPAWSRVRNRVRGESTRASTATSGRFSHAQSEDSSESTECAADALQDKLLDLTQSFDTDLAELGLDENDLYDLPEIMKNLNKEIKKEKDPEKKAALQLALSKVKNLSEKVELTKNITQRFVRSQVLTRFENDLASRAGYGETYLHEIAAGTPDLFKGIRKDAGVSILEVYKKQINSYISHRDAGNLQESNRIGNLATGYNVFMTHRQANGKSAGQNFMEQFALDANLNPRAVVQDVYSIYSPAAAEIQNYLVSSAAGGAQSKALPLPGVLNTNPVHTTEAGLPANLQPSQHTIGRANRTQQIVNPQQGRASVPAANGPPRGGTTRGF